MEKEILVEVKDVSRYYGQLADKPHNSGDQFQFGGQYTYLLKWHGVVKKQKFKYTVPRIAQTNQWS